MQFTTVRFVAFNENILFTESVDSNQCIDVYCKPDQRKELEHNISAFSSTTILNLIHLQQIDNGFYEIEFFVYEPDYLLDISSLAECFKVFGHHPLNYILARLKLSVNTRHILLGNTANYFIDQIVNENAAAPLEYLEVLRKMFHTSPFEFAACEDLKNSKEEQMFFEQCKMQFNQIKHVVDVQFKLEKIDREKIILEPSFICNTLGIQGRLDLMLSDHSAFVELKSGKAIEDFSSGQYINSAENHYMQMSLYLAVIEFNLNKDPDDVGSYLLYSKYPKLSRENHSRQQLHKALRLRNAIVGIEYLIQNKNSLEHTNAIIGKINSATLNTEELNNRFFNQYLKPNIDHLQVNFLLLNNLEQMYFNRLYTFVCKELWLSKLGLRCDEGEVRLANLWNASFEQKKDAASILYGLRISINKADEANHFLEFIIPTYDNFYIPNFRQGDAIILYARNDETDTPNNRQVFKGAIELLDSTLIRVRVRSQQRNLSVLPVGSFYAIEHDYMDASYNGMYKSLVAFMMAKKDRRDLLLCQRLPHFENLSASNIQTLSIQKVVDKAMAAKDCFLLVGPPGTGKTSLALHLMVEDLIDKKVGNILLLAYTNRAVDEICQTLHAIDPSLNYIRVGSELNCNPLFRSNLFEQRLKICDNRTQVNAVLDSCTIYVGTASSLWAKSDLFLSKTFHTAIVDEATQLLEPQLLGILCAKDKDQNNAVKRFILIGDYKQLPAVVLQSSEESSIGESQLKDIGMFNLSNSLFERLYFFYKKTENHQAYDTLTVQGRMHPAIASFPSDYFYGGKLLSAKLDHQIECMPNIDLPHYTAWENLVCHERLLFSSSKPSVKDTASKVSHDEVEKIIKIVKTLYKYHNDGLHNKEINGEINSGKNRGFEPSTIGIITSFRNQMALIRRALVDTGIDELSSIVVDTVERFQGSQRDIIIYSFAIQSKAQVENLPNIMIEDDCIIDRKLNVVLTRARKQVFILGNEDLLCQNNIYRSLLNHIRENGAELNDCDD